MSAAIQASIEALRQGRPAMCLYRGESGTTHGTLLLAAENASAAGVNILAREGRGVVCVGITGATATQLDLRPMIGSPAGARGPHAVCTVSIDAKYGITTGISAGDRAHTLQLLASPTSTADDLVRPGHLFPYIAHTQGVFGRPEPAEIAVDLMHLAGLATVGAFCGVLDADGAIATEAYLLDLAAQLELPVFRVEELVRYRLLHETFVSECGRERLETDMGTFELITYADRLYGEEHSVLRGATPSQQGPPPMVYVHRACVRSDVFGATTCDCADQLKQAQSQIQQEGGLIVYVGRGTPRGTPSSAVAASILASLGIKQVRLINPWPGLKDTLGQAGCQVVGESGYATSGHSPSREAMALRR